jgi:hypothetical protein
MIYPPSLEELDSVLRSGNPNSGTTNGHYVAYFRILSAQAPPRAHSREIQAPWEIAKPELAAREQVLVILDLQNAIQEPSTRKAYLTRRGDESWEKAAQRAFGFPIKFDTEVQPVEDGHVIPCLADFEEEVPRRLKEGSVHVSPLYFPIGIKAVFNDQTANITIQNNTPVSRVEETLSMRWGVRVQFAPNKRFEFVSTIPGQRTALTEEMRARVAADAGRQKYRISFAVVDGWSGYPVDLVMDTSLDWGGIRRPSRWLDGMPGNIREIRRCM